MKRIKPSEVAQAQRFAATLGDQLEDDAQDRRLELKADGEADTALEAERVEQEQGS